VVHRARSLSDQESLHSELEFLRTAFRQNGYSDRQIRRALNSPARVASIPEKPDSVAFLSYVGTTFNRISRLLSRHNIKSVGLPPKKIPGFLRPVKDDLGLKTPGVYSMPCECGQVYIGQTGRSIETRVKKHQRHIRLQHPYESAVAEHSINLDHRIQLQNTTILSTKSRYMDRMISGANKIELKPNNMNREDGLRRSRSWKPLIHALKGCRKRRSQHCQNRLGHLANNLPFSGLHPAPAISLFPLCPPRRIPRISGGLPTSTRGALKRAVPSPPLSCCPFPSWSRVARPRFQLAQGLARSRPHSPLVRPRFLPWLTDSYISNSFHTHG
jgi:hypothetical protein